jgi:tripartite-type tricarboxylate transporter receptor subunit TctC
MPIRPITTAIASCIAAALAGPAAGQSLKSGTLTMVVPFAAGGPSDVAGRLIGTGLAEVLGQNVVVENPIGAGGTVGSLRVSRSTPDGSQFVIGNSGTHAWSQSLYKTPPYNTLTDFTLLGMVVESPRTLIVPKNYPANTLQEFIAHIKANQSSVKYGHAGPGSASHVSCILLNAALGVDVVAVPYRGLAIAIQDLIAGRIDYMCDSPSTSKPQMDGNYVKVLATTGKERFFTLPDIPTAIEQGLNFDVNTWQGLFLAKDTPQPIVRQLSAALNKTLDLPTVRDRFKSLGEGIPTVERRGPEYFRTFIAEEIQRWSGPIKASGVTVE